MAGNRVRQVLVAVVATATLTGGLVALDASAAAAASITSAGPLTQVGVGTTLNCSANHVGDSAGEFFGGTSCGTFTIVDGVLYGPFLGTAYTPVSQTGPTGAGTAGDPYKIVTVVDAGTTGIRITQTDTYTTGLESFRTDVALANTSGATRTVRVYRAADCYLQDSDSGYGALDTGTGAVACTTGLAPGARIEQWFPITAGSHAFESFYGTVYNRITSQLAFDDTCGCTTLQDNGAGLSWDATVTAGTTKTFSSLITFSPLGILPLSMSIAPDAASVPASTNAGYTIGVHNPNPGAVVLASLSDVLPASFTYVPGSTTGLTSANPTVGSGNTLIWAGPLSVPGGGDASLHFSANVGATTGTFTSSASATNSGGYTIVPTGPDGAVTVTGSTGALTATLAPVSSTATVGALQSVVVTANRGVVPQPGLEVQYDVISGPNAGALGTGTTDAAGQVEFQLSSSATGTDVLRATVTDGATSVDSNTASITWTPAPPFLLTLNGFPSPPTITVGNTGNVRFTIHNGGTTAVTGVYADLVVAPGATGVQATVSPGACSSFLAAHAVCLVGTLPAGGTATIDVLVRAEAASLGHTIDVDLAAHATGSSTAGADTGPTVVAASPNRVIGFVPPGGTIATATTATAANPTIAAFKMPSTSNGAPITLRLETTGLPTFCGGQPCDGKIIFLSTFAGVDNPRAPARLHLTWDKTIAGRGTRSRIYIQKGGGAITTIPNCDRTDKHIAVPSPCIHKKELLDSGDVRFEILLLSGDPRFARR